MTIDALHELRHRPYVGLVDDADAPDRGGPIHPPRKGVAFRYLHQEGDSDAGDAGPYKPGELSLYHDLDDGALNATIQAEISHAPNRRINTDPAVTGFAVARESRHHVFVVTTFHPLEESE